MRVQRINAEMNSEITRDLDYYLEKGYWNGKGSKSTCPKCGHFTFSLKSDRSLAKCFHPSCGFYAIAGYSDSWRTGTRGEIYEILDEFYKIANI